MKYRIMKRMKQLIIEIIAHWLFLPKTKKSSTKREYIHIYIHILFFEESLRAEFGAHIQVKDGEKPYGVNLVLKG